MLLVCVTTTRGAAKSDTPITCEAGVCTFGTRTSVTCYFNEDISASRHAFSVDLYPFNASRDDIGEYRSCTEKTVVTNTAMSVRAQSNNQEIRIKHYYCCCCCCCCYYYYYYYYYYY